MLPRIIFAENHEDPIMGKVLEKLTPKLKELGYRHFFDEMPEGHTVAQDLARIKADKKLWVKLANLIQQTLKIDINDKEKLDLTDPKLILNYGECIQFISRHPARLTFEKFLIQLRKNNMEYCAVDLSDAYEGTWDRERVTQEDDRRNESMAGAYFESKDPFFARIGLAHVQGIQKILLRKSASCLDMNKFAYYYVYSKALAKGQAGSWERLCQTNQANLLTEMVPIDACKMSVDEIVDFIIKDIKHKMQQQLVVDENEALNAIFQKQLQHYSLLQTKINIQSKLIAVLKKEATSNDIGADTCGPNLGAESVTTDLVEQNALLKSKIIRLHEMLEIRQGLIIKFEGDIETLKKGSYASSCMFFTSTTTVAPGADAVASTSKKTNQKTVG